MSCMEISVISGAEYHAWKSMLCLELNVMSENAISGTQCHI